MLHLRISDSPPIMDINREFDNILIDDRPIVRLILNKLEHGRYESPYSLYDCFGTLLDISCLSAGAKAALLTAFRPDREISLLECGYNAIGYILNYVKDGSIVVHSDICLVSVYYDGKTPTCDVSQRVSVHNHSMAERIHH